MDFSGALKLIKQGVLVKRSCWTGKFLFLVNGSTFSVNRKPLNEIFHEGTVITYKQHIDARYEDGTVGVYSFTQDDILADDWTIYEPEDGV